MFLQSRFTSGKPSWPQRVLDSIRYRSLFKAMETAPALDEKQSKIVEQLKCDGHVTIPAYLKKSTLIQLQTDFQDVLEKLKFETPCLAQTKIDPAIHASLIRNNMLATPDELSKLGVAFEYSDCESYEQIVRDFNPSTLTVYMLQYSNSFREVWLDTYLLAIVANYMGMIPQLSEAYVRRNFPAPYRTMNHYWHRDLNNHSYLLKMFVFLNDCNKDSGPHEYVRGSCTDKYKLDVLNGQRYYSDAEVDSVYPPQTEDRLLSIVPAGTVILEDTRGLHRANIPLQGYRDLGYAVFMPLRHSYQYQNYLYPESSFNQLSDFQKLFIPKSCIV